MLIKEETKRERRRESQNREIEAGKEDGKFFMEKRKGRRKGEREI